MLRRLHLTLADFAAAPRDAVAVTGPSGAGKTQLLRAIADLDPNEAAIDLDGAARDDQPAPAWRARVAYVPATPAWWADSVAAHFLSPPDGAALASVGLPADCGAWPVARLSTGETVRLGLLRALERKPQVLLTDEPTGPLDADAKAAVERVLTAFCGAGGILLFTTHEPAQIGRLGARVLAVAADGQVTETSAGEAAA